MTHKFDIALYEPDMPPNTAVIFRLSACLDLRLHIIEPIPFSLIDKRFRGTVMDYLDHINLKRHKSWSEFYDWTIIHKKRTILCTTKTDNRYFDFLFKKGDIILFGKETAGVPKLVHDTVLNKITIPMKEGMRSLNLASSVSMIAGEINRQLLKL